MMFGLTGRPATKHAGVEKKYVTEKLSLKQISTGNSAKKKTNMRRDTATLSPAQKIVL